MENSSGTINYLKTNPKKLDCIFRTKYFKDSGCGSGELGLVVGGSAHSRGLKLVDHCHPFQPIPFYVSMLL